MKNYNISEAEWKVMEVLWNKPHATIKDITSALSDTKWSYSTIKTLVLRLTKKGAIGADTSSGIFKYYPVANQYECKQMETKSFLSRVYGGSVKMLMANLAGESNLSDKEVQQLMEIIDKIDGGENG